MWGETPRLLKWLIRVLLDIDRRLYWFQLHVFNAGEDEARKLLAPRKPVRVPEAVMPKDEKE